MPSSQEFCSPTSSLVKKTLKFLKANSLGEPLRVSQAVKLKAVRIFFIKIFYWVLSCLVQLQYFENWVWQCWRCLGWVLELQFLLLPRATWPVRNLVAQYENNKIAKHNLFVFCKINDKNMGTTFKNVIPILSSSF